MRKYLELFTNGFDETINEKTKPENKPYIGYSLTDGKLAYTVIPAKEEEPDPIVGIDYLCLEPLEDDNELAVLLWTDSVDLHYSFDKITWNAFPITPPGSNRNFIPVNKPIYFKGNNSKLENSPLHLSGKGKYNVSGDITTLLNEVGGVEDLTSYGYGTFARLFGDDEIVGMPVPILDVVDASRLKLPSTILNEECYVSMFYGCGSLVSAPKLPATTLAPYCYAMMFELCRDLKSVTCLATDMSSTWDCTAEWLLNVSSTGTFTKHPDMNGWTTGSDGIPSGWTVVDAEV